MDDYEIVYTMTDYYDGPREGIADFRGSPHVYRSTFRDFEEGDQRDEDVFLLMPIDEETFRLAREAWAIWLRWADAYHGGETWMDTHPALPEDVERQKELISLLPARLAIEPERAIRAQARFRPREEPNWSGIGSSPLEVSWRVIGQSESD